MSLMLQEIHEQPEAVARALQRSRATVAALARDLRARDVRHVVIAARGTSDNAAVYGRYLLELVVGVPVALAAPSLYTIYGASPRLDGALAIGISQSGEAPDVVQVLSSARASGAVTVCITNVPDSPIVNVSDHVLLCNAGAEQSVAATKTYTTTLAILAALAAEWAQATDLRGALSKAPADLDRMLMLNEVIEGYVERYRYIQECAVLARGLNLATALETALKLTETCYVVAKPFSAADFLHGPIAMVADGFACMLFNPTGHAYASMLELALNLRERNAELIVIAATDDALSLATRGIRVEFDVDERISPLIYIVPGQLWAHHLAGARGIDPDHPRGLEKVTRTR